jgi:hypothetical protein
MGEREYSQMMGPMQQSSAKIKLFGTRNSPPAYSIRDFLQRSVVAFDWIELWNDEEARSLAVPSETPASTVIQTMVRT